MWTEIDRNFPYELKYHNQMVKNHFFRNENWFNTLNYTFIYSGTYPTISRKLNTIDDHKYFVNFEKFITKKKI